MAGFTFCFGRIMLLMFLILWASKAEGYGTKFFNIMSYGAVADGQRDNSQVKSLLQIIKMIKRVGEYDDLCFISKLLHAYIYLFCFIHFQALLRAWKDGCEWDGKAVVLIPYGIYMLDPVEFSGPCKGPLDFVIRGILKAPTHKSKIFTTKWINFQYVDQLTITGGGTLDGQGSSSWGFNDCNKNSNCPPLPTVSPLIN